MWGIHYRFQGWLRDYVDEVPVSGTVTTHHARLPFWLTTSPLFKEQTMKHVHHAYHWVRDLVEQNEILVSHVPGDENPDDIFTKPLGRGGRVVVCLVLCLVTPW